MDFFFFKKEMSLSRVWVLSKKPETRPETRPGYDPVTMKLLKNSPLYVYIYIYIYIIVNPKSLTQSPAAYHSFIPISIHASP